MPLSSVCGYKFVVAPARKHAFPVEEDIFRILGITATGSAIDVRYKDYEWV